MLNILHILIFWASVFVALTGGDALAGAIGAVVSETAAEAMDKPGTPPEERRQIADKARLIGDTVAFVAGRDVASADSAGKIALDNNHLGEHLTEIDAQRAIAKAVLSEEESAQYLELLDADEKRTLAAARDPFVQTAALSAVGFGIPLVAQTAGVLGTAATAHYFGSIAVDSGAKGLVKEAKEHPIMTTLAVMPFVPGPKGLGKGATKTLAKTGKLKQRTTQVGNKSVSEVKPQRIIETKEAQEACWGQMKESGEWIPVKGYGKPTLRNKETKQLAQKSHEKFDIEVYNKHEKHEGVIRPSEGRINTSLKDPGRRIKK